MPGPFAPRRSDRVSASPASRTDLLDRLWAWGLVLLGAVLIFAAARMVVRLDSARGVMRLVIAFGGGVTSLVLGLQGLHRSRR